MYLASFKELGAINHDDKELIDLLQRLDPSGNKEVVFGIDYGGEYEKETIIDAETYDDDEVVLYY